MHSQQSPKTPRTAKKTSSSKAPAVINPADLRYVEVADGEKYMPKPLAPAPAHYVIRRASAWWVRCTSGEMIHQDTCSRTFLDANALNQKKHPCWKCPHGIRYREMASEGKFPLTRFESLYQ